MPFKQIRSDEETRTTIRYSLEGKGATEVPINLFTVNPVNGYVRINGILDREETAFYYVSLFFTPDKERTLDMRLR